MNCEILTTVRAAVYGCEFEYWNRERHEMACCGKAPVALVAGHAFCIECLPDALVRCGSGVYFSEPNEKGLTHQLGTKEAFLAEAQRVARKREPVTV